MNKDNIIKIDMGAFLRTVTAQLDNVPDYEEGAYHIYLDGRVIRFQEDWLNNILRILNGVFFRCYATWEWAGLLSSARER